MLAGDANGTNGAAALIDRIREAAPWSGPRHAVFVEGKRAPRDRVICNCKQVTQSQIAEAIAAGADLAELKSTLGCGSVCGSCVPEIRRLYDAAPAAAH
jgi:assimilatory nitrate reductase catalytic subunit